MHTLELDSCTSDVAQSPELDAQYPINQVYTYNLGMCKVEAERPEAQD